MFISVDPFPEQLLQKNDSSGSKGVIEFVFRVQ